MDWDCLVMASSSLSFLVHMHWISNIQMVTQSTRALSMPLQHCFLYYLRRLRMMDEGLVRNLITFTLVGCVSCIRHECTRSCLAGYSKQIYREAVLCRNKCIIIIYGHVGCTDSNSSDVSALVRCSFVKRYIKMLLSVS